MLEAQQQNIRLHVDKSVQVSASEQHVLVTAEKHITLMCGGAFIKMGGGDIEMVMPGTFMARAAVYDMKSGSSAELELPDIDTGDVKRVFKVERADGERTVANLPYAIALCSGEILRGVTSDSGLTEVVEQNRLRTAELDVKKGDDEAMEALAYGNSADWTAQVGTTGATGATGRHRPDEVMPDGIDALITKLAEEFPIADIRTSGKSRTVRKQAQLMAERRRANRTQFLAVYAKRPHIQMMDEWVCQKPLATNKETVDAFETIITEAISAGATVSNHLSGYAADIRVPKGSHAERSAVANRIRELGGHVIDEGDAVDGAHWHIDWIGK